MGDFMCDLSNDDSPVIRFLSHYTHFAGRGHFITAQALKSAIDASQDPTERKLLAVKVYAEFAAAIEDLLRKKQFSKH